MTQLQVERLGEQVQPFGPYSGTSAQQAGPTQPATMVIVADTPQMYAGRLSLVGARSEPGPLRERRLVRREVARSLDRSLTEHADVWSELARQ